MWKVDDASSTKRSMVHQNMGCSVAGIMADEPARGVDNDAFHAEAEEDDDVEDEDVEDDDVEDDDVDDETDGEE